MMNNGIRSSVTDVYDEDFSFRAKIVVGERIKRNQRQDLCVVPGNHERRSKKESDDRPLYDVCCSYIEDKYRDNAAFIIIRMGDRNEKGIKKAQLHLMCDSRAGVGFIPGQVSIVMSVSGI